MSTSGGGILNAAGYLVLVVVTLATAGRSRGGTEGMLRHPRPAALVLWAVVAVPSVLQFAVPALLDVLARRPELIAQGQVWRLLSSVVVQDGGVFGTVSNLVVLYLVACVAVAVWGAGRAVLLFVLGGFGFDLLTTFVVPSPGAGNSGATFTLAAAVVAGTLVWERTTAALAAAVVTAVVGAGLLVLGDAHGFAFLGGLVVGAALALVTHPADRRPAVTS